MAKFFINRPVFAIVISIIMVLVGTIAALNLPIAQYPQIQPPTVAVSTNYVGANAEVVNETVAQVIEQQVNGVQGMDYMSATSDDTGSYNLDVYFELGIDGDIASVKVQNSISQANASLPTEVKEYGVVTKKSSSDMAAFIGFYAEDGQYDEVFLRNYIDVYLMDAVKRVNGVGDVSVFGPEFAVRVWLNPDRLAELGLTVNDVIAAVQEQNLQAPAGTIGAMPVAKGQEFQYTGKVKGRLTSVEDFENVIIKANPGGAFIKIKDVARVETGARSITTLSALSGKKAVGIGINLTSDANAMETVKGVMDVIEEAAVSFPPGMKHTTIIDNTEYITESITEVVKTFIEAMLLVLLIVFLFLQSWRATLIPMLAIPVSLIGTFGAFIILDFTINTLTLFAMVLAIGLVVDDAIVVIEAVEHHMRYNGLGPKEATFKAMEEVSGPVVAIAFVLAAVFVPVAFLGGMMGVLYRQFALTIAVSMMLSAFIALSLTPALCAMMLKPHDPNAHKGFLARFFDRFNDWFERTTASYSKTVRTLIDKSKLCCVFLLIVVIGTGYLYKILPSTFVPEEDQGFFITSITLPEGASMNRTEAVATALAEQIGQQDGVRDTMTIPGFDVLSGAPKSNAATIFTGLHSWGQRKTPQTQIMAEVGQVYAKAPNFPEASILAFNPPSLPGLGMVGGFTMMLQDITGHTNEELNEITQDFIAAANQRPELQGVYSTYKINSPAYEFEIDREKVKTLGIQLSDVFTALQVNYGGSEVNDLNMFGRTYKVVLQAEAGFRNEADTAKFIFVKSSTGQMVPLDTLLKPKSVTGPSIISRFNAARSVQINGTAAPGYSSGQALTAMEEVARDHLPEGFKTEWSGQSREEKKAGSSTMQVMALAIVFVFLCLAALYESWSVPYAVLLSVPTGIFGAAFAQQIMGLENSVYMQIGVIMLIGLAAKNAILIVEFAKVRVDGGMDPIKAAVEAAGLRLRPIIMTSLAFIIGCLPLARAAGAGAGARNAMGTAVVGGMTIATGLGIFLIPVLFVVVEMIVAKISGKKHDQKTAAETE